MSIITKILCFFRAHEPKEYPNQASGRYDPVKDMATCVCKHCGKTYYVYFSKVPD